MTRRPSSPIQAALVISMCYWTTPALVSAVRAQDTGKPPLARQAQSEEAAKQERKKELEEMRRRAEGTTVIRLDSADKTPAKLVAEPLMRYSAPVILLMDATLWAYGAKGRPLAVQKVESFHHPSSPKYFYALFSLSDGLIEVRWPGEVGWSSAKPGIEVRSLPGGPKPAAAEAGRLLQMKETSRRFTATMSGGPGGPEEMRLLPRPLYRYADPDSGIQDGAIFALSAYGTHPGCLILIELDGADVPHASWKYGPVRMTDGGLSVRLDGNEVWTAEARVAEHGRYATWLCFFARQQGRRR